MVARTDLAWRILQIVALALPALAILLQVMTNLDWEGYDSAPHQYHISASMLFLIIPMTLVGIIAAGVLAFSYDPLWLRVSAGLMATSFLFVPLVLHSVYKRARIRNIEFMDREKEALENASEAGELPEDEVDEQIEQMEVWQEGFVSWAKWRSEQVGEFFDRHPFINLLLSGAMLIWWVYVIISGRGLLMTLLGIPIVIHALVQIGGEFVDVELPVEAEQ